MYLYIGVLTVFLYFIFKQLVYRFFELYTIRRYIKSFKNIHRLPKQHDTEAWKKINDHVSNRLPAFVSKMQGGNPDYVLIELSRWLNEEVYQICKTLPKSEKDSKRNWNKLLDNRLKIAFKTKIVMTDECPIDEAAHYFEDLYKDDKVDEEIEDFSGMMVDDYTIVKLFDLSPVTNDELLKAFACNSDSRGPFDLCYSMLKELTSIHPYLITLYTELMKKGGQGLHPMWKHTRLFLQYKQGDVKDSKNYRPIALMALVVRVYHRILSERFYNYVISNNILDINIQKGFLRCFSGVQENSIIAKGIIKDARDNNKSLSMLFLDIKNAYGSIRHPFIVYVLKKYKFPRQIVDYVANFHCNTTVHIALNKKISQPFQWKRGIYQGDAFSNILFVICMNIILVDIQKRFGHLGYDMNNIKTVIMGFVDDLALVCGKRYDLNLIVRELNKTLNWCGFELKPPKSRILEINQGEEEFYINNCLIERITDDHEFKYLGSFITQSGNEEIIYQRCEKELKEKFLAIDSLSIGKYELNNHDKYNIYKKNIMPQIRWMFGNNIWTKKFQQKIEDLERQYIAKWADEKYADDIFIQRRQALEQRKEYMYKCSSDIRIQKMAEKIYGEITAEEKAALIKKKKEISTNQCSVYSTQQLEE